jgi:hypothetical protein
LSHYLKAVGTGAFAEKDLVSLLDEVYVTTSVSFDPTTITGDFILLQDHLGASLCAPGWSRFGTDWEENINTTASNATPVPQSLGTFQTIESHYNNGVANEAWVDGNLLWSTAEAVGGQVQDVLIGQLLAGGTAYFDWVKIGTTRGGADLYFDDFSGDLSGWDATNNVSIVSSLVSNAPASFEVSVAFDSSALADPATWTNLAADPYPLAATWQIDRGRSSEFDKTVTGTASIGFFDVDGDLDPTNSGSPFDGTIDPMRQVRIRLLNPVSGVWSHLFKGFASDWQYEVDVSEKFSKVTLEAADAFDLLAALEMTPGHHGDTVPAQSQGEIYFDQGPPGTIGGAGPSRIHKALDDAGWPETQVWPPGMRPSCRSQASASGGAKRT